MRVDESHHFENKYNGSIVTYHRPVRDLRSHGNRSVLAVRNTFAISSKNIADTNTAVRPVAVILKIAETPSSISAFVTKKTLNTVHINELGDPADEAPFMVHKNDRHNKLKLGSEEVLAGSSRSSKTLALGF